MSPTMIKFDPPCDECKRLRVRISELHETLAKITKGESYPEELEESRQRVGFLMAKVGSLKAERDELKRMLQSR